MDCAIDFPTTDSVPKGQSELLSSIAWLLYAVRCTAISHAPQAELAPYWESTISGTKTAHVAVVVLQGSGGFQTLRIVITCCLQRSMANINNAERSTRCSLSSDGLELRQNVLMVAIYILHQPALTDWPPYQRTWTALRLLYIRWLDTTRASDSDIHDSIRKYDVNKRAAKRGFVSNVTLFRA